MSDVVLEPGQQLALAPALGLEKRVGAAPDVRLTARLLGDTTHCSVLLNNRELRADASRPGAAYTASVGEPVLVRWVSPSADAARCPQVEIKAIGTPRTLFGAARGCGPPLTSPCPQQTPRSRRAVLCAPRGVGAYPLPDHRDPVSSQRAADSMKQTGPGRRFSYRALLRARSRGPVPPDVKGICSVSGSGPD